MSIQINPQSENFSTAPQISADDIAEIAKLGFKTIINNRPDGEGGADQPTSAQIKAATEKLGLAYFHIPVIPGNMKAEQVEEFSTIYAIAAKPVLSFCKTGNRAANIFKQSQSSTETPNQETQGLLAWLKSKCLITRFRCWYKTKCPFMTMCRTCGKKD